MCIKHLNDFQKAIVLARVVEDRCDGPVMKYILTNTVLPFALSVGDRWLGSWAFWVLHQHELAMGILVVRKIFSNLNYMNRTNILLILIS